jgi:hypothetical protein
MDTDTNGSKAANLPKLRYTRMCSRRSYDIYKLDLIASKK